MGLGTFATCVVQVGGAYLSGLKFAGLAYICLKLKEILAWVQILDGQFLFLCLTLEISFCKAEYLKIQDYFAGAKHLLDQMSAIVEVARNSLCWIFFVREGAGNGPCNLKRYEIHVNLVKTIDLTGSVDE